LAAHRSREPFRNSDRRDLRGLSSPIPSKALVATHHQERVAEAAGKVREAAAEAATRDPPDLTAFENAALKEQR